MWIAFVETRHFMWTGYGNTKKEAFTALKRAWDKEADPSSFHEIEPDVCTYEVLSGDGYRDYTRVVETQKKERTP